MSVALDPFESAVLRCLARGITDPNEIALDVATTVQMVRYTIGDLRASGHVGADGEVREWARAGITDTRMR